LPKTVTRQRRGCDLKPGPSAPESSTLTTRLPSHPQRAVKRVCVCCSLVQMADSSERETLTPRRSRRKRRPLMCRLCGCPLHDPTPPKRPRRHGPSPPGGGSQTGGGSPRGGSITGGCAGFRAAFDRLNSTTPTSTLSGATSLARTTTDQRLNCGGDPDGSQIRRLLFEIHYL